MSEAEQGQAKKELVRALSARFAELRRKTDMTQQDVAEAMDKPQSNKRAVRRLEHGGVEQASLLAVTEYLRAVRAGFANLKDVLDRYTSLPIPPPVIKLVEAAPPPRTQAGGRALALLPGTSWKALVHIRRVPAEPDLETIRVQRRAGYWVLRKVFEHALHRELNAIGASPAHWMRRRVAGYSRKVFNALFRTRGPKEPKRRERLARLREWALKQLVTQPIAEYLEDAVTVVFEDMRAHDELDWVPPPAQAYAIMAVKPKHRVVTDAQMCLAEWWEAHNRHDKAVQETVQRANTAAERLLPVTDCDARALVHYRQAAMWASNIGCYSAAGTRERQRSVALFRSTPRPAELERGLLERLLGAALEVWDQARPTFPPRPGPRPR